MAGESAVGFEDAGAKGSGAGSLLFVFMLAFLLGVRVTCVWVERERRRERERVTYVLARLNGHGRRTDGVDEEGRKGNGKCVLHIWQESCVELQNQAVYVYIYICKRR